MVFMSPRWCTKKASATVICRTLGLVLSIGGFVGKETPLRGFFQRSLDKQLPGSKNHQGSTHLHDHFSKSTQSTAHSISEHRIGDSLQFCRPDKDGELNERRNNIYESPPILKGERDEQEGSKSQSATAYAVAVVKNRIAKAQLDVHRAPGRRHGVNKGENHEGIGHERKVPPLAELTPIQRIVGVITGPWLQNNIFALALQHIFNAHCAWWPDFGVILVSGIHGRTVQDQVEQRNMMRKDRMKTM